MMYHRLAVFILLKMLLHLVYHVGVLLTCGDLFL